MTWKWLLEMVSGNVVRVGYFEENGLIFDRSYCFDVPFNNFQMFIGPKNRLEIKLFH